MRILVDNIKCKLEVGGKDFLIDPDLMTRFREYMSVKVPGAYFMNKKLPFHYDGMKYFITPKGSMATGFLPTFLDYLDSEYPDLPVELEDIRPYIPEFKEEFVSEIGPVVINEQYIHQKQLIQVYDNKLEFRGQSIPFQRGIIDAATNAGKTAIMAGLYLNMKNPERMIVLIHKKQVYRQLVAYFEQIFDKVGQINADKYDVQPFTVAMMQTLSSRKDDVTVRKDLAQFTILAADESHLTGSNMYKNVLIHCPAAIRMFVSGTALDSSNVINNLTIVGLAGKKLGGITKMELMEKGISTPVQVRMMLSNTRLTAPALEYEECMDQFIYYSEERLKIIADIIKDRVSAGPILIAVDFIHHGSCIFQYLASHFSQDDVLCMFTCGEDREQFDKVEAFREGGIDVLVSTGILKEGMNLPLIQTLIYAVGEMSKISIKQWMGRIERKDVSKDVAIMYDFYDVGRYVSKHSDKRLAVYQSEGLPIEMNFDLKEARSARNVVARKR